MTYHLLFKVFIVFAFKTAFADKFFNEDIIIEDPKNVAIDFSSAIPGPDGTVCVQRKKYVDKKEKDQLKECFVQNVTQCYYTYVTEYSDGIQEKCVDFYWKTCKIAFKERVFNATTRNCKRPLVKKCDDGGPPLDSYGATDTYGNPSQTDPRIVCETFFETECNTTHVIPAPSDEPLQVTFCDKFPRKICAPDNCKIVEDVERCEESIDQSTIEQPIELCDLQPQKHCSQIKVSVPRLVPEQKCRQVEKEICNTRLVNPHDIKKPVFIKYCTKRDLISTSAANSYLPPSSQNRFNPQPTAPRASTTTSFTSNPAPLPPVVTIPPASSYRPPTFNGNGQRAKRVPDSNNDVDLDDLLLQQNSAAAIVPQVWEGNDDTKSWQSRAPEQSSSVKRVARSIKFNADDVY